MIVFYVLLAALGGALVVVQASINGELRLLVGDPYRTALISTTVSTIFLFALSGLMNGRPVPDGSTFSNASWWMWTGGILGAVYVAAAAVLITKLGSAVLFTLVIFGQLVTAVLMDHFGLIGLEKHPVSAVRIVGILLVLAGVVIVRKS